MFVVALLFGHFQVPSPCQHSVLAWGVIGALVLRGALIAVGAALVQSSMWAM